MRQRLICLILLCSPFLAFAGKGPLAPELTQTDPQAWLNSEPLTLVELRGQVVLIKFWTFGCINCVRSIAWVKSLEERYRDRDFTIIGVHTPEFSSERSRATLVAKVEELGIRHPVMMDNDYAYWNALGNRYWPAFYLIDKQGRVRHAAAGEVHAGTPSDRDMRRWIDRLLAH